MTERERERVREGAGLVMTLLHNVCCCCCMTRLVTLTITTPQSSTKKVCVRQTERGGGGWCWEGGLQSCPWVSRGMIIDCTAVAFNYVSIQSMQKAAGAKVTFLHSDYSRLLCGLRPSSCFHQSAVILHQMFLPARAYGSSHSEGRCVDWKMHREREKERKKPERMLRKLPQMCSRSKVKSRTEHVRLSNEESHLFSAQTKSDDWWLEQVQGLDGLQRRVLMVMIVFRAFCQRDARLKKICFTETMAEASKPLWWDEYSRCHR